MSDPLDYDWDSLGITMDMTVLRRDDATIKTF